MKTYLLLFLIFSILLSFSSAEQCGRQAYGALCPDGLCCSEYGWCGTTELYCKLPGCQSQCTPGDTPPIPTPTPPAPAGDVSDIISRDQFYKMLLRTNDGSAKGFYTYEAFITAAKSFPSFGTTGDLTTRKREIAAFFGQTSHQTNGGWPAAKEPYTWGYYYKEQASNRPLCDHSIVQWPCAPGQSYHGRGPIMLSWNFNYGPCGRDIGVDLLHNPSIASTDSVVSFKTAIWFWMTPQVTKPSCHDVITNQWQPSHADIEAGRLPGYGLIGNIITGGECYASDDINRIGYYKRYCDEIFGVDLGSNLECANIKPFPQGSNVFLDAAI